MVDRESRYKKPASKEDAPKETKEAATKAEATAGDSKGEGGDGAQKTSGETPNTEPAAESGGDGAPNGPDAMGDVTTRHMRERGDMNKRHMRERGDAADRHEAEHKDMSKRQEKELADYFKTKMRGGEGFQQMDSPMEPAPALSDLPAKKAQ